MIRREMEKLQQRQQHQARNEARKVQFNKHPQTVLLHVGVAYGAVDYWPTSLMQHTLGKRDISEDSSQHSKIRRTDRHSSSPAPD